MKSCRKYTIRELRARQLLTVEELAKKVGVTRMTLLNWQSGKTCPDVKTAIKLAEILGEAVENIQW